MPGCLDGMEESHHFLPKDVTLPDDRVEAKKLQYLATRYILLGDTL